MVGDHNQDCIADQLRLCALLRRAAYLTVVGRAVDLEPLMKSASEPSSSSIKVLHKRDASRMIVGVGKVS